MLVSVYFTACTSQVPTAMCSSQPVSGQCRGKDGVALSERPPVPVTLSPKGVQLALDNEHEATLHTQFHTQQK